MCFVLKNKERLSNYVWLTVEWKIPLPLRLIQDTLHIISLHEKESKRPFSSITRLIWYGHGCSGLADGPGFLIHSSALGDN